MGGIESKVPIETQRDSKELAKELVQTIVDKAEETVPDFPALLMHDVWDELTRTLLEVDTREGTRSNLQRRIKRHCIG